MHFELFYSDITVVVVVFCCFFLKANDLETPFVQDVEFIFIRLHVLREVCTVIF